MAARDPAPPELALVETFCNTVTHLWGDDQFATLSGANDWLRQSGFPAAEDDAALTELIEARETVRAFLVDRSSEDTRGQVNALAQRHLGTPRLTSEGILTFEREGSSPSIIAAVLSALLLHGLSNAGERLKACAGTECHYVFYDHSKSRTATWCDMNICGARHKMRSYRKRVAANGRGGQA